MCLQERNLAPGEIEIRFALLEVRSRLLHAGFVGPQIQNIEDVSGPHFRTRLELPALEVSIDPATDLDHVLCIRLRRKFRKYRNVGGLDLSHNNGRRGGRWWTTLLSRRGAARQENHS